MSKLIHDEIPVATEVVSSREATIATVSFEVDGQQFLFTGTAKVDPSDRFDPAVGVELALARAFESASKRLNRRANGLVKCAEDNRLASIKARRRREKAERKAARASEDVITAVRAASV